MSEIPHPMELDRILHGRADLPMLLAGMTPGLPRSPRVLLGSHKRPSGPGISYSYRQRVTGWSAGQHIIRYSADPLVWKALGLAGAFITHCVPGGRPFILVMLRWQPARKAGSRTQASAREPAGREARPAGRDHRAGGGGAARGGQQGNAGLGQLGGQDIEADAEEERRILDHALKNGRPLTPGEARAEPG